MDEMRDTIGRLRRAMSRNPEVMALCDEVERLQRVAATSQPVAATQMAPVAATECPACQARKARQRERMRSYRHRSG